MGLFDKIFNNNNFNGGIINPRLDEDPNRDVNKIVRQVEKEKRKEIEDGADKIHPTLCSIVKTAHNLEDTIENAQDSLENGFARALFSLEVDELNIADHLFVQRLGYTHHGLYIGDGKVIHYLLDGVGVGSLEDFADGAKIHKKTDKESPICYPKDEVVSRAYRRLGEDKYNLAMNNCENFVRWCRSGSEYY